MNTFVISFGSRLNVISQIDLRKKVNMLKMLKNIHCYTRLKNLYSAKTNVLPLARSAHRDHFSVVSLLPINNLASLIR